MVGALPGAERPPEPAFEEAFAPPLAELPLEAPDVDFEPASPVADPGAEMMRALAVASDSPVLVI
jgi:hypothetical protein